MSRRLQPKERFNWMFDSMVPFNMQLTMRANQPLDSALVTKSLRSLQVRYPLLRVRIREHALSVRVEAATEPLRVVIAHSDSIELVATRELHRRLVGGGAPLCRCVLVPGPPDRLIFTVSHIIADANGLVRIILDFMKFYRQYDTGHVPTPVALPPGPELGSLLPSLEPKTRWLRSAMLTADFLRRLPTTCRRADEGDILRRFETRSRTFELSVAETREFDQRCMRERLSLHAVCSALGSRALGRLSSSPTVMCFAPVEMRRRLKSQQPLAGLGDMSTVATPFVYSADPAETQWSVARAYNEQLNGSIARGEHLPMLQLLPWLLKLHGRRGSLFRSMQVAAPTLIVSTVGRLRIPEQFDIESAAVTQVFQCFEPFGFLLSIGRQKKRLTMFVNYAAPTTTEAMADEFMALLRAEVAAVLES